jgi:hypothetical protein
LTEQTVEHREPRLDEILRCFGYFGFGSGYAFARFGPADDTRGLFCNRCVRATACWTRHRARVEGIIPELAKLATEIAETHRGAEYVDAFRKATKQTGDRFVEPFLAVMSGNMQDGAAVGVGGRPNDRGRASLTWPLVSLEGPETR